MPIYEPGLDVLVESNVKTGRLNFDTNAANVIKDAKVVFIAVGKATIRAFDPEGMEEAKSLLEDVTYCEDEYECMQGADAAVILTEWNQFLALDLKRIASTLESPTLIDLRNIYTLDEVSDLDYHSIGRFT